MPVSPTARLWAWVAEPRWAVRGPGPPRTLPRGSAAGPPQGGRSARRALLGDPGCDLGPPGSGAGAGSSVRFPLPAPGSAALRGAGAGAERAGGIPPPPLPGPREIQPPRLGRLPLQRPRPLGARSGLRSRRGPSAGGSAVPGASLPSARRRSAPSPSRRHHVTRPEPKPGQVSRGRGGDGHARRALRSAPILGLAAARRRPRPGLRRPRLRAPGGAKAGPPPLPSPPPTPQPRPGLVARGPDPETGEGEGARRDHAERGPVLPGSAAGVGQPLPGLVGVEARVWEGVTSGVLGGSGVLGRSGEKFPLQVCECECVSRCLC